MNDIKSQMTISTENKILNEFDSMIKTKELKNVTILQQIVAKIGSDFLTNFKSVYFRDWFSTYLDQKHPDESGLMVIIDLFYKSQENRSLINSQSRMEATSIFIDLLYETIEKAQNNHIIKKEIENTDNNPTNSATVQLAFTETFFAIVTEELWLKIKGKFKELRETMILENPDELVNEIYGLFQVLNERLVCYMKKYFDDFLESEVFRQKFSQNYMRKSCLINSFWFEKPQIKLEIHRIEKNNFNSSSAFKPPPRERNLTTVNMPKNFKEYNDVSQSCISKSMNILNDKL